MWLEERNKKERKVTDEAAEIERLNSPWPFSKCQRIQTFLKDNGKAQKNCKHTWSCSSLKK